MVDPISITSLILAIVPVLLRYAEDAVDYKDAIKSLTMEIMVTKGILEQIEIQRQFASQEPDSPAASKYLSKEFHDLLKLARQSFVSLEKALKPAADPVRHPFERVKWPFKKEEVHKHVKLIERVKSGLFAVLTTDISARTRNILLEVSHISKMLESEQEERMKVENDVEREKLLNRLAPVSPKATREKHKRVYRDFLSGTNDWFIEGTLKRFCNERTDRGSILWIKGKSGAGKTVLLSNVVESLSHWIAPSQDTASSSIEAAYASASHVSALAYFYCSFDDQATHSPRNILGSMMAQLAPELPQVLDECSANLKERQRIRSSSDFSDADLLEILVRCTSSLRDFFICIDAINETQEPKEIENLLFKLAASCKNLRAVVTSVTGSSKRLQQSELFEMRRVDMNARDVDKDIQSYVNSAVTENEVLSSLTSDTKTKIKLKVSEASNGMFRYAQLQIENLANERTERYIEEALESMPEDLNDSYVQILERIPAKSRDRSLVQRALLWMSFIARPIDIFALADAVVLEDHDRDLDARSRLPSAMVLIDLARGLLEVDSSSMVVSLSHFSVMTFLTSDYIRKCSVADFALSQDAAHETLMRKCLTYLMFDKFKHHPSSLDEMFTIFASYPLLAYAGRHWAQHLRTENTEEWNLIQRFFISRCPGGGNYNWWVACTTGGLMSFQVTEQTSPLYYAASFGYPNLVKAILKFDPNEDLEAGGSTQGSTALQVACFRRQEEVARILTEAGADPFSLDGSPIGDGFSAYFYADLNGWDDVKKQMEANAAARGKAISEQSLPPDVLAHIQDVQRSAVERRRQEFSLASKTTLFQYAVPSYRLKKETLEQSLSEKFGRHNFNIEFENDRFLYHAPHEMSYDDILELVRRRELEF